MIMIVKTPGSQMGSPAAVGEGAEAVGGRRGESGERREVQSRSSLTSTAPKARSSSTQFSTLDDAPRISPSMRERKVYYKTTTNRGKR